MKRMILILCIIFMLANILAVDSFAMDTRLMTLAKTPVNKLMRGLVNCLTCLVELPAAICDITKRKGPLLGSTLGVVDGIFTSFMRLGTGAFDAVTFVIPPYDKPLLKPEYAIDSAVDKMGPVVADW
jgi:putative exosortase-associated protein (TIGR04073 family)